MSNLFRKVWNFRETSPLSFRMLGYILVCSSLFTLFATGIQVYADYRKDVSLVDQRMNLIETSYQSSLARSLWSLDQKLLRVQMQGILNLPDIVHLHLQIYPDSEIEMGEIPPRIPTIKHKIKLQHSSDDLYELGELTITASLDDIYRQLRQRIFVIMTTQAFKTFFISVLILWIFQYLVTRHLSKMANYARGLNIHQLDMPLALDRSQKSGQPPDELQRVTDAINEMRLTLLNDIEKQKQDAAEIRKLSLAIEQSPSSVLICDKRWKITYANQKFSQLTGHNLNSIIGKHPKTLTHISPDESQNEQLWHNIEIQVERAGMWQGEMHSTRHGGEKFWEQVVITPIRDTDGESSQYLILGEDISVRKRYEQQLLRQANYDLLTGLPNRMLALDRLKLALAQSRRDKSQVGLMFLDLDNFKHINDTLGHDNGDTLLIEASRRIASSLRGNSTVARLGGDEFLIILPSLESPEDSELVAARILQAFSSPFLLNNQEIFVSTSIGIAIYPTDSENSSTLLQQADAAMYQAKHKGKSAYHRFTPDLNQQSRERLKLETQLRKAIEQDELLLYYQPIVETASGQLVGAEALIRWDNPLLGLVAPDKFIPLAEETGLITSIGEWVLHTACRDVKKWHEDTGLKLTIAVNVSPRQFRDLKFIDTVQKALEVNDLAGEYLELEITERLLLDDSIETFEILHKLDAMGVKLSVDDFGTGYSALSYLKSYPFDSLKIDRSFVKDVNTEAEDAALVTAIITMAHSLGLKVIGEGVEDAAQMQFLRSKGCDYAQGYYYNRPVAESDFCNWISENRRAYAT
ncbi:EAL domain-containing protein [Hahella aquimaris]|uniref:bifunctional diguanylate cyclase/phosphodiesterase n=1 Tax=Hahella sp. HNIBRBA332 TaxID=3015983 RepID=UPI00273CB35C|nr:EAL domain-containing protein [Hahella sp. HNIBRBA332]WLQ17282.1 EAL domain-containing protein [Hahella sp. HNIBRBA332]